MKNYAKRFYTKDGKQRVTFYQEEYASNPRDWTDEPLHCCDWSRECSIMQKDDPSYSSARSFLNQMLVWYGKREAIIDMLVENGKHMTDGKSLCNNALVYDKSLKGWALLEYTKWYAEKDFNWKDATFFDGRKDEIDLGTLVENLLDSTIDELQYYKYWTDGIKMMSYGFGYYGKISFYDEVSCDAEGICWLEKDEFLKYSGNGEDYWKDKSLKDIEWLCGELEAWSENEVYFYKVEKAVKKIICTRYPNGEQDDTEEEVTDWEETESCGGYYGKLDKIEEYILGDAGFKKEELEERDED